MAELNFINFGEQMLKQVSDTLLAPSNLSHQSLLNIFDVMSHRHIDYADLYFQLSQDDRTITRNIRHRA